ncbi:hypothetical protein H8959_003724 [Pygathrix nigripes]
MFGSIRELQGPTAEPRQTDSRQVVVVSQEGARSRGGGQAHVALGDSEEMGSAARDREVGDREAQGLQQRPRRLFHTRAHLWPCRPGQGLSPAGHHSRQHRQEGEAPWSTLADRGAGGAVDQKTEPVLCLDGWGGSCQFKVPSLAPTEHCVCRVTILSPQNARVLIPAEPSTRLSACTAALGAHLPGAGRPHNVAGTPGVVLSGPALLPRAQKQIARLCLPACGEVGGHLPEGAGLVGEQSGCRSSQGRASASHCGLALCPPCEGRVVPRGEAAPAPCCLRLWETASGHPVEAAPAPEVNGEEGGGRTAQTLNWAQGPRCEPHRVQVPRACPSSSHPAALPSRAPPAPSAFTEDRGSRDPASLKLYGPSSVLTVGGEEGVSGTERSQCQGSRRLLKRWACPSTHRHWIAGRALHMGARDPVSPGGSCRQGPGACTFLPACMVFLGGPLSQG